MRHVNPAAPRPVFVDRSGRRRRLVKLVGTCLGVVLATSLALLAAAVSGAAPMHVPGFPDAVQHAGGGAADATAPPTTPPRALTGGGRTPPAPSGSRTSVATPVATPAASPSHSAVPTSASYVPTKSPHPHPSRTK
jgi:hypothetical protein